MCVRDSRQPPSSKKILERPAESCIPHPNRSFFLREFWAKRRCAAALALPVLLGDEKEPTIHGDCFIIFLKNISLGSPVRLAWYLSNQILGAWPCLNSHRASSTEGTPRFKMILGGSVCESFAVLTAHSHAPIKTGKARVGPILLV